jgi:ribosomal protein S18 acetylase RimI-like enzyme
MNYKIRRATPVDIDEIINLCEEHAVFEGTTYWKNGKAERLSEFLFNDNPRLQCLIAENGDGIVGYATYSFEISTWDAGYFTHMDCLYLRSSARGIGIGEALVKEIAKQTRANGLCQLQWQTPISNERAIKFYYRLGANSKEKLRFYINEDIINQLLKM